MGHGRKDCAKRTVANDDPGGKAGGLVELVFEDGVMGGLKLLGFAVWERRTGKGRNVTFPARQSHRERRASELLAVTTDLGDGVSGRATRAHPAGVRQVRRACSPRSGEAIPPLRPRLSVAVERRDVWECACPRSSARDPAGIEQADGCRTAQLEEQGASPDARWARRARIGHETAAPPTSRAGCTGEIALRTQNTRLTRPGGRAAPAPIGRWDD